MYLEKLIQKLKDAPCKSLEDRKNVAINIKLSEFQIKIREQFLAKNNKKKSLKNT